MHTLALPVNANLYYRDIMENLQCDLCLCEEEIIIYSMRDCLVVGNFWLQVGATSFQPGFFTKDCSLWLQSNSYLSSSIPDNLFGWDSFFLMGICVSARGGVHLDQVGHSGEGNGVTTQIKSRNHKCSTLVEELIFTKAHVQSLGMGMERCQAPNPTQPVGRSPLIVF